MHDPKSLRCHKIYDVHIYLLYGFKERISHAFDDLCAEMFQLETYFWLTFKTNGWHTWMKCVTFHKLKERTTPTDYLAQIFFLTNFQWVIKSFNLWFFALKNTDSKRLPCVGSSQFLFHMNFDFCLEFRVENLTKNRLTDKFQLKVTNSFSIAFNMFKTIRI